MGWIIVLWVESMIRVIGISVIVTGGVIGRQADAMWLLGLLSSRWWMCRWW